MKNRPTPFAICERGLRITVRVVPKASRATVGGVESGADGQAYLKVRVTVKPENGKANTAVRKLLAKSWGLAPGRITIVSGTTARNKVLEVEGNPIALLRNLEAWLKHHEGAA